MRSIINCTFFNSLFCLLLVFTFGCEPDDQVTPDGEMRAYGETYETIKGGKIRMNLLRNDQMTVPGTIRFLAPPAHGDLIALSGQPDAQFEFRASDNFDGILVMEYRLESEYGMSNVATVTIKVVDCSQEFKANNDTIRTSINSNIGIPFSTFYANDQSCPGDIDFTSLTFMQPGQGATISVSQAEEKVYFNGPAKQLYTFNYSVCNLRDDTLTFCDDAYMSVQVMDSCQLIFAAKDDDVFVSSTGFSIIPVNPKFTTALLYNDIYCLENVDFRDLTITQYPTKGGLNKTADGNLEYTPNINAGGTDLFMYEICAKQGTGFSACSSALVRIHIQN